MKLAVVRLYLTTRTSAPHRTADRRTGRRGPVARLLVHIILRHAIVVLQGQLTGRLEIARALTTGSTLPSVYTANEQTNDSARSAVSQLTLSTGRPRLEYSMVLTSISVVIHSLTSAPTSRVCFLTRPLLFNLIRFFSWDYDFNSSSAAAHVLYE